MTGVYRIMVTCLLVATIFTIHAQFALAIECPILKTCQDFQLYRVAKNDPSDEQDWKNITDEITIGRQGHWEGIVPVLYEIKLNFSNQTHYTGSVNITVKIVKDTERILINHQDSIIGIDQSIGGLDYKSIQIKQDCSAGGGESIQVFNSGCICSASLSVMHGTLGLKLLDAKLRKDSVYNISLDFYGKSKRRESQEPGLGDASMKAEAFILSTLFQMRYARDVFPCFDHPRLKAKFQLCMEYPGHLMAASNTPALGDAKVNNDRKEECFEETPVMSTYLFTFALMENYTRESTIVPDRNLTIELFAPTSTIDEFRHIVNESIRAIEYMERITKFPYPLPRLGFIVAYTKSDISIENFGLVRVYAYNSKSDTIYHETVHQWLGNLVTVPDWTQICLQEGLPKYYEWKIENGLEGNTVTRHFPAPPPGPQEPFVRHFERVEDFKVCYKEAPYIFYALDVWDGQGSLSGMVEILLKEYAYKSAGVKEWNEALDEAIEKNGGELRGYLRAWMTQPGPVSLLAWHTSPPLDRSDTNTTCIAVRQMIGNAAVPPRPVPIVLHTFSAHGVELAQSKLVLTEQDQVICDLGGPAFLINPNVYLPYYKYYGLKNYYHLMKGWDKTFIGKHDAVWIDWFCGSFLRDELPMAEEPWGFSKEVLIDFMNRAKEVVGKTISELHIFERCDCCLASNKALVEKTSGCITHGWNNVCSGLRLVKQVFN